MAAHAELIEGEERKESQLSASITKKTLLLFIVGDILGGGIYARTGEVAGKIGGAIWTGFALAAVIAASPRPPTRSSSAAIPRPPAPPSTSTRRSRRRC